MILTMLYYTTIIMLNIIQKIWILLFFIFDNVIKYNAFVSLNIISIIFYVYYEKICLYDGNNIENKKKFNSLFNNTINNNNINNDRDNNNHDNNNSDKNRTINDNDTNQLQKISISKCTNTIINKNISELSNNPHNYTQIKKNKIIKKSESTKLKNILYDVPKNMYIVNYKLQKTPEDILKLITQENYKLNDNKISALGAYLTAKALHTQFLKKN